MPEETVDVDGTRVKVSVHPLVGEAEAEIVAPFEEYLRDEIFTSGTYQFEEVPMRDGDVRVAEYDDGTGYVIPRDLQSAIDDERVRLVSISDGWLHLEDTDE
jgi:hypothetical protein